MRRSRSSCAERRNAGPRSHCSRCALRAGDRRIIGAMERKSEAYGAYAEHDGLALAELVRRGEVSPLDLVEAAIARIERHNPALNAVVHTMYDAARNAAREVRREAPFAGVPFLAKDLLAACAGEPMSSGSALY